MKKVAVASIGVLVLAVVVVFSLRDADEGAGFRAFSDDAPASPDTGESVEPQNAAPATALPLPDPRLGEEKRWREADNQGPPPDGFGSHFVQHELALHNVFRAHLADPVELCLDEMRRRGASFDGRIVFHVTAVPARDLRLTFQLNGIRTEDGDGEAVDAELPSDVYRCMWDTVEAIEVKLPVTAISIFPRKGTPQLFVPYDVRPESPSGPVEVFDAGEMPIVPDAGTTSAIPDAGAGDMR